MTASTFRADTVAALVAVLTAQKAATPSQLRKVYSARPGSFGEVPCAYVGARNERIVHANGVRTRTMVGLEVVVADAFVDGTENGDRLDALVDLLVDRFTDAYHQISGYSLLQLDGVSDTEIEVSGATGTATYRGVVLSFGSTFVTEGRD